MRRRVLGLVRPWVLILSNLVGCGSGNTVEYPETPDPMPTAPPSVAGQPAPRPEAKREQPKPDAE